MSFVHFTLVGHFDPKVVHCDLTVSKQIDQALVKRLLDNYPPEVADYITVGNGYARCSWTPAFKVGNEVFEFAYPLAREASCITVENQLAVGYPPEALEIQMAEWDRLRTLNCARATQNTAPACVPAGLESFEELSFPGNDFPGNELPG